MSAASSTPAFVQHPALRGAARRGRPPRKQHIYSTATGKKLSANEIISHFGGPGCDVAKYGRKIRGFVESAMRAMRATTLRSYSAKRTDSVVTPNEPTLSGTTGR
jgi:hypothetical protein